MSVETSYIWIVNWSSHQDALRKRGKPWSPPWVKLDVSILDDDAFNSLPEATQLLFLKLLTLFARCRLTLPTHTRNLSRALGQRVLTRQLESLNHAGLIEFCSGTVLEQRQAAFWNRSNLEKSREEKNRTTAADQDLKPGLPTPTQDAARDPDPDPEPGKPEDREQPAAAAEEPIGETELRTLINTLPGADRRSLDIVAPRATQVTRQTLIDLIDTVHARKARNPIGLLIRLLDHHNAAAQATAREAALASLPVHNPEPIERLAADTAIAEHIRRLAENGHPWPTVQEFLADTWPDLEITDHHRAIYDAALDPEPEAAGATP